MFNFNYTGPVDRSLACLHPKNMKFLRLCQQEIINAPQAFLEVTHTTASINRIMQLAILDNNSRTFKQCKTVYSANQTAIKRYHWQDVTQRALSKPSTWEEMQHIIPLEGRKKLAALRREFRLHGEFASYSSAALYHVAYKIIPALENYYKFAVTEVATCRSTLQSTTLTAVQQFLNDIKAQLHSTKTVLACAMAARLQVASKAADITVDDVMREFVAELQQLEVWPTSQSLHATSHGLNATMFNAFQQFIAQSNSERALLRIQYQTVWLRESPEYSVIHQVGKLFVIPQVLQRFVTSSRLMCWWQNLTGNAGNAEFENYVINHQHLFARCRMLATATPLQLHAITRTLVTTIAKINRRLPQGFFARIWYHNHITQLSAIRNYWNTQLQHVAQHCIIALEKLVTYWEKKAAEDAHFSFIATDAAQLQHMVNAINYLDQRGQLCDTQQANLQQLIDRFDRLHSEIYPQTTLLEQLLAELSRGQLLGAGHLQHLYDYADNLKALTPDKFVKFQHNCLAARTGIMRRIKEELYNIMHTKSGIAAESIATLTRALYCLKHIGNTADFTQLNILLQELLYCYAKRGNAKLAPHQQQWFTDVAAVMLMAGNHLTIPCLQHSSIRLNLQLAHTDPKFFMSCNDIMQHISLTQLQQQALTVLQNYEDKLWYKLNFKRDTVAHYKTLLHQAIEVDPQCTSLQHTLKHKTVDYWLNQILWIRQQKSKLDRLTPAVIRDLISSCNHRCSIIALTSSSTIKHKNTTTTTIISHLPQQQASHSRSFA